MCFEDDDDDFCSDHTKPSGEVDSGYNASDFAEDWPTWFLFNVEMGPKHLTVANVLLDMVPDLNSALEIMKAAFALREFMGTSRVQPTAKTRDWNAQHETGQLVQYWPNGRNSDSFLTRTTSPAIDTPQGPAVLLEMAKRAVSLFDVEARNLSVQNGEV